MAPQITGAPPGGILKDVNFFIGNFTLPKAINKDRFSLGSQDSTYNASNSDPSPKHRRSRLYLFKALKIGKMESTDASDAPTSPNTVGGVESPASSPVGSSAYSTPERIGVAVAVTCTKVEPGTATVINIRRPRANATVGQNGSPIPRRPPAPVDPSSSPSIRHGLGPMMRTSRDAHQVIMGENPTFPPRMSSLPTSSPSPTLPPKTSDKVSVVSRLSRPTAASNARTASAIAIGTARPSSAVKTPSTGRSTSVFNSPSAITPASVTKTVSAVRSISATKTSSAAKPSNTTKMTSATQTTGTAKTTISARPVKLSKDTNPNRSVKMKKTTGVTRTTSMKRAHSTRVPVRPVPRSGTMTSLKTASKGFKSRISAIIPNRRRRTDIDGHGSEQEQRQLVGKETIPESDGESPDENTLLNSPSSLPKEITAGDDLDKYLSISRDQFDRLVHASQEINNEAKKDAASGAVKAYGEALVAVHTAHRAIMDLQAAVVALSRQVTDLGSQALATIQD